MLDFTAPENNLSQFGLSEGMKVADLGSGSGHYTFAAASLVGDTGRVFSVEVQKELLQRIKNENETRRFGNVEVIWGDIEEVQGTKIADRYIDAAILSNVLFQVEDKAATLAEAFRITKPGGRLLIVDWSESFGGMGPQSEHVLSPDKAREFAEQAGFVFEKTISTGAHHYGFIMKKS